MMRLLFTSFLTVFAGHCYAQQKIGSQKFADALRAVYEESGLVAVGGTALVEGKIVASAAFGLRRADSEVSVTVEDLWHHGSITKSMTATGIATLVEAKALDWNSTLDELLPELADSMHEEWKSVTLLQLLSHTAGAPANLNLSERLKWPVGVSAIDAAREKAVARVLQEPPGKRGEFAYSNTGYIIAGYAASQVSGKPWETWLRETLFEPLVLDSAGYGPPHAGPENNPTQPVGHRRLVWKNIPVGHQQRADNTPILGPAGTVHMNMQDLAHYGWVHLQGELGEPGLLLQPQTFKKLHSPVSNNYACGWGRLKRDWAHGDLLFHNGSNTMWYSLLCLLPQKKTVFVFVTNDSRIEVAEKAFFKLAEQLVD